MTWKFRLGGMFLTKNSTLPSIISSFNGKTEIFALFFWTEIPEYVCSISDPQSERIIDPHSHDACVS